MARPIFVVLSILVLFFSCSDTDKVLNKVKEINLDLNVKRFDKEFANAGPLDIPVLKKAYPYLFPAQYSDSIWVAKLKDTIQIELSEAALNAFNDFDDEIEDLELFFKHIKYFFPKYSVPKVVTLASDVDYNQKIILTDSLLLINLDNYLGADHKFYQGIQRYIAKRMDKKYLVSDVADAFAEKVVLRSRERSFVSQMIYYGKKLYLKDKLMPLATDDQKIGYTEDEIRWAQENEEPIWRNFIEQEHLYNTDNKLALRFLEEAPFSKFGLELDNESPGRLGQYIGWQIVRSFMEKNSISLDQLLNLSAEEIFKKSNYKPKK
ncbi:gliding motility lipoprotein GldB [Costertonia aggregata]|uniref:Gliding motility lipoprotein GldB n=1 Tax=Costertonia aggregata TaxID=343403 RepID=A0A7H9ALU0_9FLAO|nr:gliding motility lipoprotein GldB [Costertonia aggregata]QLG44409.1 gliding motility lipoprotein GldB [Costertonia aggregata]